jgi:hypothetical protein
MNSTLSAASYQLVIVVMYFNSLSSSVAAAAAQSTDAERVDSAKSMPIQVGFWESSETHSRWKDFPEVIDALVTELDRRGLSDVMVGYVCGSDHARKCNLYRGFGRPGRIATLIIPRQELDYTGNGPGLDWVSRCDRSQSVYALPIMPSLYSDYSSTVVRHLFKEYYRDSAGREALDALLGSHAVDYCLNHQLYMPAS